MQTLTQVNRLAAVLAGSSLLIAPPAHAQDSDDEASSAGPIEVITVTATKREESLREVSGSISALTEESLQDLNAQGLSDYINRVPGVVFNDYQPGVSEVVIRGVASTTYHEANQTTTGYYLNEVPLIEPGFPLIIPDVDSFDLQRVEVLRGPQGTLFGSSSLGGAVNYVVNEADPTAFFGGAEMGTSYMRGAEDMHYAVKGVVNIPLIDDRLAVRLVGLQRFDAGHLDNTLLGESGSNDLTVQGYRASVVYAPSDSTTVSFLGMFQEYELDDQTYVIFNDDPETFDRTTNVAETQDTDFALYSLRLEQALSFGSLTALASHVEKNGDLVFDFSVFGGNDPRTDTPLLALGSGESTNDYLELRLASGSDGPATWLVGANYTKLESSSTDANFIEGISDYIDANPGEFGGQPGSVLAPNDRAERTNSTNDVTETAIFGEFGYQLTDTLSATVGGRFFEYETRPTLEFLPNADLVPPFNFVPDESSESGFIPKLSLTYTPNDDLMIYGLYSEGFRIGGVNVFALASAGLPLTFDADETKNFELGTRIDLLGKKLQLDVTAYHIEWDDVQARLFTPVDFRAYTTNGGGADIDGVELTVNALVSDWFDFNSSISYNDAALSEFLPDTFAPGGGYAPGTQLPGASEWILANNLNFRLNNLPFAPTVSLNHRYLSEAPVAFGATLERGDFHLLDLNASADISDRVSASIFIKNLADEYGVLNAPFSFAGSVTRPRTVGATLRLNFD
ncbi:MAG: TonB-dependent receptor [Pseudomonadota bacterium]